MPTYDDPAVLFDEGCAVPTSAVAATGSVWVQGNLIMFADDATTIHMIVKHEGAATPTDGYSGEIRVGTDVIWVNDAGTWKSAAIA